MFKKSLALTICTCFNVMVLLISTILYCNVTDLTDEVRRIMPNIEERLGAYEEINLQHTESIFKAMTSLTGAVIKSEIVRIKVLKSINEKYQEIVNQQKNQLEINKSSKKRDADILKSIFSNIRQLDKIRKKVKNKSGIDIKDAEKIKQANIFILNYTAKALGSGTHIKINDRYYILTCAHLINAETDELKVSTNRKDSFTVKIVKVDKEKDLMLLSLDIDMKLPYLEISEVEPRLGSNIFVIGNPSGFQDIITNGIISSISNDKYLTSNKAFFGNSGGALIYKGKIIGVLSQTMNLLYKDVSVNYSVSTGLTVIKEFLKGIE